MPILQEGQRLRETYVVERFIGEGAFAEVYRVLHRFLGRQAMKVFKMAGMGLHEIEGMLREAQLLSKIGHPNVIRVFEANTLSLPTGEHGFFTMEYIPGGSLADYWSLNPRHGHTPLLAVEIIRQVTAAIAVAHRERPAVVHRDIKPQNILVGYDGRPVRVRVSDFGLAKQVNPLTMLASSRGTLAFKPPEALANQDSPAADVWAIGTTLYLMLTDGLPFPELSDRTTNDAHGALRSYRSASIYNIQVDDDLDSIIASCLVPNARDRCQDAGGLLSKIDSWLLRRGPTSAEEHEDERVTN